MLFESLCHIWKRWLPFQGVTEIAMSSNCTKIPAFLSYILIEIFTDFKCDERGWGDWRVVTLDNGWVSIFSCFGISKEYDWAKWVELHPFGLCRECTRWGGSISDIENKEFKEPRCPYSWDNLKYVNLLISFSTSWLTCASFGNSSLRWWSMRRDLTSGSSITGGPLRLPWSKTMTNVGFFSNMTFRSSSSWIFDPFWTRWTSRSLGSSPNLTSVLWTITPELSPSASLSGTIRVGFWALALGWSVMRIYQHGEAFTIL